MSRNDDSMPKTTLARSKQPTRGAGGASSLPRAFVACVGIGCAFGAGLVVGGGMKPAHGAPLIQAASDDDVFAAARRRSASLHETQGALALSFHDELVKAPPAAVGVPGISSKATPPAKPKTAVAAPGTQTSIAAASGVASAPPAARAAEGSALEDDGAEPDPAVVEASAPKTLPAAAAATTPPPAKQAPVSDEADDGDDGAVAASRHDPKRLEAAMAKVLGAQTPKAVAQKFTLQVASLPTEQGAKDAAQKLKAKGVTATIVAADVPGKGTVYRVRAGSYADRGAADAAKEKLAADGVAGFVVAQ